MFNKNIIFFTFIVLVLSACSPPPPGVASFTVISDQTDNATKHYAPIGASVEDKDCLTSGPLFLFFIGKHPVEETLISKMLEENNADVLLNTEIEHSSIIIPYIFMRSCVNVSGIPAKLRKPL